MVTFTNIPNNMDKKLYLKSLSKEYKMPLDMIYCLINTYEDEESFFKVLEWNLQKNAYGWKK